jgi:hypothetical protein
VLLEVAAKRGKSNLRSDWDTLVSTTSHEHIKHKADIRGIALFEPLLISSSQDITDFLQLKMLCIT